MTGFIFSTGSARGGTGLLTRMLSVNKNVEIALDPYLSIFKVLRNTIVRQMVAPEITKEFDYSSPLSDYYYSNKSLKVLDQIINSTLNLSFPKKEIKRTIEDLKKRSLLSSGDLSDSMNELNFNQTFGKLILSGFNLIKKKRKKNLEWVGIHENWTIEFFIPLAKYFKKSKFLILTRDPRAVITSSLKVSDSKLRGQILSYAKCLRKMYALSCLYMELPIFKNRLMVLSYEDLSINPIITCKRLCNFLNIKFSSEMLDTNNFIEPSDGKIYNGFSSFEKTTSGFSKQRTIRWRKHLLKNSHQLIDFLCGPEMELFGYKRDYLFTDLVSSEVLIEKILEEASKKVNWRCDFNDIKKDFGYEFFRHLTINKKINLPLQNVRELFLFKSVFDQIIKN